MTAHDAQIIEQSLVEPAAFGEIFDRHSDDVHAYLARRAGHHAADELTGEVFRVAFEQRRRFDRTRPSARPWLYGIATNMLRRHRRDGWRRQSAYRKLMRTSGEVPDAADASIDAIDAQRQRHRLVAAVSSLAGRDREALLLHVWQELTYAEIAEALSIPVGTVRSRIARARRNLRGALGAPSQSAAAEPGRGRSATATAPRPLWRE